VTAREMAPGLMDVGTRTSVVMGDELKHFVNDDNAYAWKHRTK